MILEAYDFAGEAMVPVVGPFGCKGREDALKAIVSDFLLDEDVGGGIGMNPWL